MKRKRHYLLLAVAGFALAAACEKTGDELSAGSNFDDTTPRSLSPLDRWIEDNFVTPYNIEVVYRWQSSLHDLSRYLNPPTVDRIKPALEAVKQVWIEPYNAAGGRDFIKTIAPRQFVLVGGKNIPPGGGGRGVLGFAEAGLRIALFEVDLLQKNRYSLRIFLHTIQHEYAHILDQTQPFDEKAWIAISPQGYTSQWYQKLLPESNKLGFISSYARMNVGEDFAETISHMLTRSRAEWNAKVNAIPVEGRRKIREKENMLVDYYRELGIDLYALQDSIHIASTRYLAR